MCGFIGVIGSESAVHEIYDGLLTVQHRGQDAAGIVTYDGQRFHMKKGEGLVRDIFSAANMQRLQGDLGVGHVRYPTVGSGWRRGRTAVHRQLSVRHRHGPQRQRRQLRRAARGAGRRRAAPPVLGLRRRGAAQRVRQRPGREGGTASPRGLLRRGARGATGACAGPTASSATSRATGCSPSATRTGSSRSPGPARRQDGGWPTRWLRRASC